MERTAVRHYEMRSRDLLDALWRRRIVIVRVLAVFTAAGLAASLLMHPVYRASVLVTSDKSAPAVVLGQPGFAGPNLPEAVGVASLDTPTLVALSMSDAVRQHALARLAPAMGTGPAAAALDGLRAEPLWDTELVRISVESGNPHTALAAAQAVAASLVDVDAASRRQWATELRRSIQRQLPVVDHRLRAAEDALVAFKAQHGDLPLTQQTTTRLDRLAQLEGQRVDVRLQQREVAARIAATRRHLSLENRMAPTQWSPSPLITTLQTQLASQEIELSGLRRQFTARHPAILSLEAKIAETRRRLDAELANSLQVDQYGVDPVYQQLVEQLRQDEVTGAALAARDRALTAAIGQYEEQIRSLPANELAQARLAREVKEADEIHQILTEKLQQAAVAESSIGSVVRIVDPGRRPLIPVRPRWLGVLLGAFVGLVLGVGGALVREQIDDPVKSVEHAECLLRVPVIGAVPRLTHPQPKRGDPTGDPPPALVTSPLWLLFPGLHPSATRLARAGQQWAMFAESFRYLRTNLLSTDGYRLPSPNGNHPQLPAQRRLPPRGAERSQDARAPRPRTLLVTSPGVGEGKDVVAANLAIALAHAGRRVMLVECDLRRPDLDRAWTLQDFEHEASVGLTALLRDERREDEVLRRTAVQNLWFLPAGTAVPSPSEALGSPRMRRFLERARVDLDVMVLAAPPILPVPDAAVLAPVVDGIILVVRVGTTPSEAVQKACEQLDVVGGRLLGAVVTGVPTGGVGAYGNYYARYYGVEPSGAWYADWTPSNHAGTRPPASAAGSGAVRPERIVVTDMAEDASHTKD